MNNNNKYYSKNEIKKLVKKEIGRGTDGRVLKIDNKTLVKLYHAAYERIMNIKNIDNDYLQNEDVKIYKVGTTKDYAKESNDNMRFYLSEDDGTYTRLAHKEGLERAIERQQFIKRSKLPQGMAYIDGKLSGCTLIPQNGIPIHKLKGLLPINIKALILKDVLISVKELTDNYIYPIDLDNSPYTTKAIYNKEMVGHSHVYVKLIPLKTAIIDLDGKSTVYTDFESDYHKQLTYSSFKRLMDEILFDIDYDLEYEDYELKNEYLNKGVPEYLIDNLVYGTPNYEDLLSLLESFINQKAKAR